MSSPFLFFCRKNAKKFFVGLRGGVLCVEVSMVGYHTNSLALLHLPTGTRPTNEHYFFLLLTMEETTPTRRRPPESGNEEILASIANSDSADAHNDDSKKRRHLHLEVGPLVVSGAALERVRARFVSL